MEPSLPAPALSHVQPDVPPHARTGLVKLTALRGPPLRNAQLASAASACPPPASVDVHYAHGNGATVVRDELRAGLTARHTVVMGLGIEHDEFATQVDMHIQVGAGWGPRGGGGWGRGGERCGW